MRRMTAEDYHKLARSKDLEWIGDEVPTDMLQLTKWRCRRGHEFWARASNVKNFNPLTEHGRVRGRHCPYCSGRWRKTLTDYHEMAARHGVEFVGPMPVNTREHTRWRMPDGEEFMASYRALATRRTPVSVTGLRRALEGIEGEREEGGDGGGDG